MSDLSKKVCIACEGGTEPLSLEEVSNLSQQINNWQSDQNKEITKEFEFNNFTEAISFVNKLAEIAEKENHHPNIFIHSYKKVKITLSTHAIGGLSENDFIVAAKIDEL